MTVCHVDVMKLKNLEKDYYALIDTMNLIKRIRLVHSVDEFDSVDEACRECEVAINILKDKLAILAFDEMLCTDEAETDNLG